MAHTLKTFQVIHMYFTKSEETSRCILYSSLLCLTNHPNIWWFILHRISRLLKVNINWLMSPTTDFSRQKFRIRMENPNSIKINWKARKKPSKGHTKNIPFVFCEISKNRICDILSSRLKSSEQVLFDSDGSSVTVDNSENAHICS